MDRAMDRARTPHGYLVTLLLLCTTVGLAPTAARAQQQQPRPDDGGFAAHFHAQDTTVLVIEDPLPHLRALLTSDRLRRAVRTGAIGRLIGADAGRVVDAAEGWDWLERNQRWVPKQVAVGLSPDGFGDVDHLFRAIALVELLEGAAAGDGNDPKLREEQQRLRQAAMAELRQLQVPRLRVYVRFRKPEDAAALLDMLKLELQDVNPADLPASVKLEQQNARVTVGLAIGDLIGDDDAIAEALAEIHVIDPKADADPAAIRQAVAAVRALRAEASLERVGSGLLLTLGPASAGGPAGLPAGFLDLPGAVGSPADPATLLWARWNAARLKEAATGWVRLRERWVKSLAYRLLPTTDDYTGESMLDALQLMAVQVDRLSVTGSARAWADAPAAAVRVAMIEHDVPPAADLAAHPVAALLPADAEAYHLDTTTSLGELVSDQLLQVEDRLAMRSLKAEVKPDDPAARTAQQAEAGYYAHFARLRELVHHAARGRFEPGSAVVVSTKGKIERVEVTFERDARPQQFGGRDLPVPELALVGRPKAPADEASVRRFVEEAYAALATGIRSAARPPAMADRPLPELARIASEKIDLGLGVPTWGFDPAALTDASGEAKVRVSVAGDLRPHYFVVDGTLVLCTSPRLSKAMLAARSAAARRLALPAADGGILVSAGRYPGETLARAVEHAAAWVVAATDNVDRAAGRAADPADTEQVTRALDAVAQFARLIGQVEWRTVRPEGQAVHVTRGAVLFDDGK